VCSESDFLYDVITETTDEAYPDQHTSQTTIRGLSDGDYENYWYVPHKDVSVNEVPHIRQ